MSYLPLSVWKNPYRLIMGEILQVLSILNGFSSFLHTIRTTIKAWMSLNFVKIPSHILILELAPLEHLKKLIDNVVTTLAPSFLIGSSSFLQVTRTTIKAWMSLI